MELALTLSLFGVAIGATSSGEDGVTTADVSIALPNVASTRRSAIADSLNAIAVAQSWTAFDALDTLALLTVWISFEPSSTYLSTDTTGANCVFGDPIGSFKNWGSLAGFGNQVTTAARPSCGDYWATFDGVDDYLSYAAPAAGMNSSLVAWRPTVDTQPNANASLFSTRGSDIRLIQLYGSPPNTISFDNGGGTTVSANLNGSAVGLSDYANGAIGISLPTPESSFDMLVSTILTGTPTGAKGIGVGDDPGFARQTECDIYCFLASDQALDSTELDQVQLFIQDYYQLNTGI